MELEKYEAPEMEILEFEGALVTEDSFCSEDDCGDDVGGWF